jgi:hypothetical protein
MVFVKAMPLDETQINKSTINNYQDYQTIFNKLNIELMFTLTNFSVTFQKPLLAERKHVNYNDESIRPTPKLKTPARRKKHDENYNPNLSNVFPSTVSPSPKSNSCASSVHSKY